MQLLGVRIDNFSMSEVIQKIGEFLSDGRQHYIATPNPDFLVKARRDAEFLDILNKADLNICDGVGIFLAAKFLGEPMKARVAGADLVKSLKLKIKSYRIFLLGGRDGVAGKIAADWPEVVGFCEEINGIEPFVRIGKCQPDILLVALGAPKQEKWIARNLTKMPSVKVAIGVGGAFDLISGRLKRAPLFMQKIGLEWLWRLSFEPWRIGRVWRSVAVFSLLVLHDKISKRH